MTFSQLLYFQAACQYQNITQAANALFVSQPTISVAIRELEHEFNVRLFFRKNKQLILTQEGKYFLSQVNELLALHEKTRKNMMGFSESHPVLRIGVTPILSIFFFDNLFRPFQETYANVQLEISEYSIDSIFNHLKDTTLDIVLTFLDENLQDEHIETLPILKTPLCFCVSKSHPFANLHTINFAMLEKEPLALSRASYHIGQKIQPCFDALNITPNIVLRASQYHVLRSYIIQNYAGGFFPKAIIAQEPDIVCLPIEPSIELTIGLAWNKQKQIGNNVALFAHFIRNILSSDSLI